MQLPTLAGVRTHMSLRPLFVIFVVACSSRSEGVVPNPAPAPVAHPPAPIGVLFERVLPGGEERQPLFGPGGSITVGPRQWTREGRYIGRHAWAIDGQIRPVAVTGSVEHPILVAIAWGGFDDMTDTVRDTSLIASPPTAAKPAHRVPIAHEFGDDGFTLSPQGTALVAGEGNMLVVRAVPSGAVIARTPLGEPGPDEDTPVACWVDDARVAWTGRDANTPVLRTLTITTGTVATTSLVAAAPLVCDPAGGAAAMVAPEGAVTLVDLATGATLAGVEFAKAKVADADIEVAPTTVAVGQRGARLAIVANNTLTVYHLDGAKLVPLYTHGLVAGAPARIQFSPEGERLAIATTALTVIGPTRDLPRRSFVPEIAFELPAGFEARPPRSNDQDAWWWAQLGAPSGMAQLPALLVNAVAQETLFADVTGIAIERDELNGLPDPDATDDQIMTFAKATMPQLFEQWVEAKIGTARDSEFTLRVGRTKGMPWFEARELLRDGCEPYDGYTRVVVDRDVVFVIRALTAPGEAIGGPNGWLARFFDLPFGMRMQTARRKGPDTGPC